MPPHRYAIILSCLIVSLCRAAAPTFDDSSPAGLVAHGQYLAENGQHDGALEKYNKAIAADDSSADAHAWKSASLISLNRLDEADAEIQRALKVNANEFTYQMIAGKLQIARGDIDAGTSLYEKAAKSSPKNAGKIYADLAAALTDRKDEKLTGRIESALKSAASADPPHLDALFNLGQSYVSAGRPEGKQYLNRYLAAQQNLPADQRDTQKIQLARKMIRAIDILQGIK